MRVLLVTTWDEPCGIAEHSFELRQAVEAADRSIEICPSPAALNPADLFWQPGLPPDVVHLNYHGALHSRWNTDEIRHVRYDRGVPVVVTYHDTGVPNSDQAKAVCAAADAFVVHEPYDDLDGNGRYWRMGVPDWSKGIRLLHGDTWCGERPVLGSIGFPFPWKNFDLLAQITADLGWALMLIAPMATEDLVRGWRAINPHLLVDATFAPRDRALSYLAGCDATAFPYVCHNTGQSGAILQGIAARKPVFAFDTCRQFRALAGDDLGSVAIGWAQSVTDLRHMIASCPIQRVSPPIVALAEQDSWRRLGQQYAALYKVVVGG